MREARRATGTTAWTSSSICARCDRAASPGALADEPLADEARELRPYLRGAHAEDLPRGVRLAFELEPIDLATLAQLVRQLADRWPFLSFRLAAEPPALPARRRGRGRCRRRRARGVPRAGRVSVRSRRNQVAKVATGQADVPALSPLVASLLATLWVSAIALVGIVFLFTRRPGPRAEAFLLSFAAGVLLATTFLELIPEAVERDHGARQHLRRRRWSR